MKNIFILVLVLLGLGAVLYAQTDDRPFQTGAILMDSVVPYGSNDCFNLTLTAGSGGIIASGTRNHLQRFGAYEFTINSTGGCDLFFKEATSIASEGGNYVPGEAKVLYRISETYVGAYCESAARISMCPAWQTP